MRQTLIGQSILALIGIAFVIVGLADLQARGPLGWLGIAGGLLIIAGAILVVLRKQKSLAADHS